MSNVVVKGHPMMKLYTLMYETFRNWELMVLVSLSSPKGTINSMYPKDEPLYH